MAKINKNKGIKDKENLIVNKNSVNKQNIKPIKRSELDEELGYLDVAFSSTSFGFSNMYSSYAVFLNASDFIIGLISTLPKLLMAFLLIPLMNLIKVDNYKRLVVKLRMIDSFVWLLPIIIYFMPYREYLLILIYSISFLLTTLRFPYWNAWISSLFTKNREIYFSIRSMLNGVFFFISITSAGFIVDYFKNHNSTELGFFIVFLLASLFRYLSALTTKQMSDSKTQEIKNKIKFNHVIDDFKNENNTNINIFLLFEFSFNFFNNISAPYLAPFLLRQLSWSYKDVALLSSFYFLSKTLTTLIWGKLTKKYGNKTILEFTIPLIALLSTRWIFLKTPFINYFFVIFLAFFFGGFYLSSYNLFFDITNDKNRSRYSAYYSIASDLGGFLGSLIGSLILLFIHNYVILFVLTFFGLIVVFQIVKKIKDIKSKKVLHREIYLDMLKLTPISIYESLIMPVRIIKQSYHKIKKVKDKDHKV